MDINMIDCARYVMFNPKSKTHRLKGFTKVTKPFICFIFVMVKCFCNRYKT